MVLNVLREHGRTTLIPIVSSPSTRLQNGWGLAKLGSTITQPERSHSCRASASERLRDSGARRSRASFRSTQEAMDQLDPITVKSILAAGRHMGRERYQEGRGVLVASTSRSGAAISAFSSGS